jgi:hypothetical protein
MAWVQLVSFQLVALVSEVFAGLHAPEKPVLLGCGIVLENVYLLTIHDAIEFKGLYLGFQFSQPLQRSVICEVGYPVTHGCPPHIQ